MLNRYLKDCFIKAKWEWWQEYNLILKKLGNGRILYIKGYHWDMIFLLDNPEWESSELIKNSALLTIIINYRPDKIILRIS